MSATTGLSAAELDQVYTRLCAELTELGEERAPMALARLALLLMHEVGDATRIEHAVSEAVRGA